MSEFIEGLSPSALKDLKSFNKELETIIGNTDIAINKLKNVKTPSQSDASLKALTDQIKAQDKAIENLKKQLASLATARRANNQQTAEESVNNGILNRQAREAATINSTLAGAYQRLSAAQNKSARAVQDIIARGRAATQTQKSYNRELQQAQREFEKLNQKVLLADRAVGRFNRNVGNYPQMVSGFKDLLGAFGLIGGVTAIAAISKGIFDTTRELQSLDLALTQVMGSSTAAAEAQDFLGRISEAYGVKIQVLTKSYTGFWAASKNAMDAGAMSGEQVNQIFESVSKAAGAMGLSVENQEGAFLALQQMISKGNIQAEELRGQLSERLPGAFGILAKSMGVTEMQLNKMLKDGKVLAAEVLPAFAKELEKAYGVESLERVESLNASITRLGNTWTNFVRSLSEGGGTLTKVLSGLISSLDKILQGYEFLFTSSETRRENELKNIRTAAYKDRLSQLENANAEELKLAKDHARTMANETIVQIAQLRAANDKLLSERRNTPLGSIISKENENQVVSNNAKIRQLNQTLSGYYGWIEAATDAGKKNNVVKKESIELTDKERKALEKLREEMARNRAAREISDLERRKKLAEDMFEEENLYADEKIKRSNRIAELEYSIESRKFIENLRLHKDSLDLQAIDANNYRTATENAEKENQDRITKIQMDAIDERIAYREKYKDEGLKVDLPMQDDFWDDQERKAQEFYETLQDLNRETKDYLSNFSEEVMQGTGFSNLFKILNHEISTFGKNFKKEFEEIEYQKRTGQLTETEYTAKIQELNAMKLESYVTTAVAISESFQEAFNFVAQLQEAQFAREYQMLEQQRNVAIMFAGESAAAKEEIDRQYEQRRRDIQRRQAEAEKRNAVFNILIDTAQGVVSALASTPPNVPLSIAIGVIGAIQAGIVASTPIPQFKDGGIHDGGLMMVNDAPGSNYKEIVKTPDGKMSIAQGRNVVMNAPKGTEIFSADKTREMLMFNTELNGILANNGISTPIVNVTNSGLSKSDMREVMTDAVKQMPKPSSVRIIKDERGERMYEDRQSAQKELLNAKINFRSR